MNPQKWAARLRTAMLNAGVMWNGCPKCEIAETELWSSKQTTRKEKKKKRGGHF